MKPATGKPSLLVLLSGADEYYPPHIKDKHDTFLKPWKTAIEKSAKAELHSSSTAIENGVHDLSGASVERKKARLVVMRRAVLEYLESVLGDVGKDAWNVIAETEKALNDEEGKMSDVEKGVSNTKL